jgi:hypothetical protein
MGIQLRNGTIEASGAGLGSPLPSSGEREENDLVPRNAVASLVDICITCWAET